MNSKFHQTGWFDKIYPFPIPSDSGTSIGAAVALYTEQTQKCPERLEYFYLGPSYTDEEIETQLRSCGLAFTVHEDIEE